MRTPILVGAAVAALLLTGGGVALAQTTPSAAVKAAICANASVEAITADEDATVVRVERQIEALATTVTAKTEAANKADPDVASVAGVGTSPTVAGVAARIAEFKPILDNPNAPNRGVAQTRSDARKVQLTAVEASDEQGPDLAVRLASAKVDQRNAVTLESQVVAFVGTRSFAAVKTELCTTPPVTTSPSPTPTTSPTTTPGDDDGGPLYATCAEATAAGAAPMNLGEPGYRLPLDSDADGVACEVADDTALPVGGAATGG